MVWYDPSIHHYHTYDGATGRTRSVNFFIGGSATPAHDVRNNDELYYCSHCCCALSAFSGGTTTATAPRSDAIVPNDGGPIIIIIIVIVIIIGVVVVRCSAAYRSFDRISTTVVRQYYSSSA